MLVPMNQEDLLEAFCSISIAEERLLESYSETLAVVRAKQRVLDGPMPFTLRDEIELHKRVMTYADACISQISTMQKLMGLSRLNFPLSHDLLRKFRDRNHHIGYKPFMPYRCEGRSHFYTWPVLRLIKAIQEEHPRWCAEPTQSTLIELLEENHKYVLELISQEKQKFFKNGQSPRFFEVYRIAEICFGQPKEKP